MSQDRRIPDLARHTGRAFWRALDEAADGPDLAALVEREFPSLARFGPTDRRGALKVMGASLALAGLTGCRWSPDESALPYVRTPEGETEGVPAYYATATTMSGYARPVLGKTYAGRPVKLEGNPDHPAWRGATDIFLQAALLGLYDPDRAGAPRHLDRPTDWQAFDTAMADLAARHDRSGGAGLRLLTGAVTSPTLLRQIDALLARWPEARWHAFEPCGDALGLRASALAFGRPLEVHPALDAAEVVVSLDHDLLGPGPHQAVYARGWSARRRAWREGDGASRLFVAEPVPSATGALAEARLPLEPARLAAVAQGLAAAVETGAPAAGLAEPERAWVDAAAAALVLHRGRSLVIAGPQQPPEIQALALILTARLGGLGSTLTCTDPVARQPATPLADLGDAATAGEVATLVVLESNPLYAMPPDDPLRAAFDRIPLRIHAGLYRDETAAACHWHVPLAHDLESWGDARSLDGTASLIQPLVRPLHGARSAVAFLSGLLGWSGSDHDAVQATWRDAWGADFDARWRDALLKGFVADSAAAAIRPEPASPPPVPERGSEGLAVAVRPHASRLGRPLRQQRLAAGDPGAAQQGHLGQRHRDQPRPGRPPRAGDRRRDPPHRRRPNPRRPGLDRAGAGARRRSASASATAAASPAGSVTASATTPSPSFRPAARPGASPLDGLEPTGKRQTVATTQAAPGDGRPRLRAHDTPRHAAAART